MERKIIFVPEIVPRTITPSVACYTNSRLVAEAITKEGEDWSPLSVASINDRDGTSMLAIVIERPKG